MRPSTHAVLLAVFSLFAAISHCPAQDALEALQNELRQVQATAPAPLPRAYERNLPLAELAVKKTRLLGEGGATWGADLRGRIIAQGQAALRRARAGEDPRLGLGKLNELAYVTANDRTVQPYYLYVPPDYTPERKWPLIVFLHGYVPSITVLDPWIPSAEQYEVAGKHGCLLLIPYGRRNTDFQGIGEVDVLASLAEVRRWYPVDEDRVYLSGVSMGGMGAWNIALRHPGMFAAVTPMCGQTDMFRWWRWSRDEVEPWKRWLIEWDNALDQAANLRNGHFYVQHGEQDNLIPLEQTKLLLEAAERQGTPIEHHFFPDEGHFIYFRTDSYDNAWTWIKQFKAEPSPRRVDFKCYSLEYDRAYWLTVGALGQWGKPGEVTAEVAADGKTLAVRAENITALRVDVKQAGLPGGGFAYTWNGESGRATVVDGAARLASPKAGPQGAAGPLPLTKRHGLCGPCEEVFDGRFLLVQGTGGTEAEKADAARKVARWAKDWDEFGDGLPPVKLDTDVSEADVRDCNLVLFGTPRTNAVLGRIADRLPVKIGDHRYELAGKVFEGPDLGLVFCYPNPLNAARYVLVYSGESWGERLSVNHKHDLLPDFVVFTTGRFGRDDTNDALCAGFFDNYWQPCAETTWTPTPPAQ